MDIEKLIEQYRQAADKWEKRHPVTDTFDLRVQDALRDAATAIETLRTENVKLQYEAERQRRSADDMRHLCENAERAYTKAQADLARVTAERDAAVECIYKIEDDLERGNDNDWAREHISEWENREEN